MKKLVLVLILLVFCGSLAMAAAAAKPNYARVDADGIISGYPISATTEASPYPSLFALKINGPLAAIGCVGKGILPENTASVFVPNANVSENSLIFISIGPTINSPQHWLKVKSITASGTNPGFTIETMDGTSDDPVPIPFNYLIIN